MIYKLILIILNLQCLNAITEMVDENTVIEGLTNKLWIVSHGGVGSEYLRSLIALGRSATKGSDSDPTFIQGHKVGTLKKRPFRGVVAHFPYPPSTGPKLCIYVYGDIYNSILSQIRRHVDNPAKLHNDEEYPRWTDSNIKKRRIARPVSATSK